MTGRALNVSDQRQRLFYGLLALALFTSALFLRSRLEGSGEVTPPRERRPMPPLRLDLLRGGSWSLADRRGQVVVINYWASWCAPCWEETPTLSRITREFASQGVAVIGVAMDERSSTEVPQGCPAVRRNSARSLSNRPESRHVSDGSWHGWSAHDPARRSAGETCQDIR